MPLTGKERAMTARFSGVAQWPIVAALGNLDRGEDDLAYFLIGRRRPTGGLAYATYLVDFHCLGVKNTFFHPRTDSADFENMIERIFNGDPVSEVEPGALVAAVRGAETYARDLGFEPHADFRFSRLLLSGIEAVDPNPFTYGRNGKPFYVSGPRDDVQKVIERLTQAVG
ncbi:MAG: hypothetical protein ACI9OJ_000991, partial [Myxococcota bacterium]